MKYYFILGNNPTLSIAEISAIFGIEPNKTGEIASQNVFILDTKEFDATNIMKRLGGTIKIGKIISETTNTQEKNILEKIKPILKPGEGKFKFGISFYGEGNINTKVLGMEIKKYLKNKNISCRWVTSQEKTLSSVVVEQNKLIDKGLEITLIKNGNKLLIGQTLVVQPFKDLSKRDYGRPNRDDQSGMLPPKLAQIMINLSKAGIEKTILDPFCGSGTIFTESLIMGYSNLIGSDVSVKAIDDTRGNIQWVIENCLPPGPILCPSEKIDEKTECGNWRLYNSDATQISKYVKPNSVDAIITEPYLGPQRGKHNINKTTEELEKLYSNSLLEFNKVLKKGGRIVIIFPIFKNHSSEKGLSPNLGLFKIINPLPEYLRKNKNIKLTKRNTIIYGREGQKVFREIVILEK